MNIWAIVVAGGSGTRFGGMPKQFQMLGDRAVVEWSTDVATALSVGVVLVVPAAFVDLIDHDQAKVVAGGATRSESVRAGLVAVPADADIIVIHDAARPLASKALFQATVDAVVHGADAAVPAVPVADTIKRVRETEVVETVDRSVLVAVQTPQAFRAASLRLAHAENPDASDDACLVEAQGGRVVIVPGEARNLKITHPDDLVVVAALMSHDR